MGLIRTISLKPVSGRTQHKDVECTYCNVTTTDGSRQLQLDTYGSEDRQIPGKKSQTLRFTPAALHELRRLMDENNL